MKILKNILLFAATIIFTTSFLPYQLSGETSGIKTFDKIKVVGTSQYLGYLNAYLHITKRSTPAEGLKMYLNNLLLNELGSGIYSNGTPFHYDISPGKIITVKYIPRTPLNDRTSKNNKPIILGTYKFTNYIQWIFPLPYSTISPTKGIVPKRTVTFKWNYTGKILLTKVTLENFTTHTKIFSKTVKAESIEIPSLLFKKGIKYRFDLEVVGPMGKFQMTNATAFGSKIVFYYWDHLYFTVK